MSLYLLIPLFIGAVAVLQGTLNREMANIMGLGSAILVNSILVLFLGGGIYALARFRPEWVPELFRGELVWDKMTWWMVLPAIFGFCIIAGIPWAMSKLGASKVVVAMVVAQIVVSMLWDLLVDHKPLGWMRVVGGLLAIAGVVLVSMDRG